MSQAARTLLEAVGTVGPKGVHLTEREEGELHLMTPDEMKAELLRLGVASTDEAY